MKYCKQQIDSQVLGKSVLELIPEDKNTDFKLLESNYFEKENPGYVFCKVGSENLFLIHQLENEGFHYIEDQITIALFLEEEYSVFGYYPFRFEELGAENELAEIIEIMKQNSYFDRYAIDTEISSGFSAKRYENLLIKSYHSDDERIFRFFNSQTNETIGFKSHKILNNNEVVLFLGGISSKHIGSSLDGIIHVFHFNYLRENGISIAYANISGRSYKELNLQLQGFKYEVTGSKIVLRKIYK